MPAPSPAVATGLVAGAASLWGLWSLALRPTGLPATVTSPLIFALMALWSLPGVLRSPRPPWNRRTTWLLLGNTTFDAINVLTFFAAMSHTTVAIAVITHYAAPVLVALAAPRIDGTRTPGAAPAALVALGGLALVLEPWRGADAWLLGAGLGLISAVGYTGNVFVARRLTLTIGASRTMCFHSALAALALAPLAVGDLGAIDAGDLARLGVATLVLGTLAGLAYLRGLAVIGAARAAMLTFCEPIVAVIVGVLAWGEALRPPAMLGAALVLGAGAWAVRAGARAE